MSINADLTALDAVLKQLYRDKNYWELTYHTAPLVGLMPKDTTFGGRNMPLPIKWANPGGISNTFSNAQSNAQSSKYSAFLLTRKKVYGTMRIDGETADVTETEEEAFVKGLQNEIDGLIEGVTQKLESDLFRSGTGSIGQIAAAGLAGAVITLSNINDITNFEAGMTLVASATDGGANRVGTELVAGVDRNLGTLTATDATWATGIPAIANGDYLMRQGDLNLAFTGLLAWVPVVAPTNTLFFGVDRTVDIVRLGGQRYDASTSGESIEEALVEGQGRIHREGGKADTVMMNNLDFRRFQKSTASRRIYTSTPGSRKVLTGPGQVGDVSISSMVLQGDYGPIDVISAPKCPQGKAFVMDMRTWKLHSKGPVPKILMKDGLRVRAVFNDDAYEVRVGGYGNVGCNAPGYNCVVSLPT